MKTIYRLRLVALVMLVASSLISIGQQSFETNNRSVLNDTDGDGVLDDVDLDSDNDGITDDVESNCIVIAPASVVAVPVSSSISGGGPMAVIGSDNVRATINSVNDRLVVDFGFVMPAGSRIVIEARARRSFHTLRVAESEDGISFQFPAVLSFGFLNSDQTFFASVDADTRYLSFNMDTDAGRGSIQIDDVRHLGTRECFIVDTDNDGIENKFDLDSDNDGCRDVREAGYNDANDDGQIDGDGVDQNGMVVTNQGYGTMHPSVVTTAYGLCLGDDEATYFNVNTAADTQDINSGDGICADEDGNCSLRAAIQEADASNNYSVIRYDINTQIELNSELPPIRGNIVIDGRSAPRYYKDRQGPQVVTSGFDALYMAEADKSVITGMNLSSTSTSFDAQGISLSHCRDILIEENRINHRARAVHVNNSCGITVKSNDVIDSGSDASNAAIYLINYCTESTDSELEISDNIFGEVETTGTCAFQVANGHNLIISDGSVPNSHVSLTGLEAIKYPIRLLNVQDSEVKNLDLSAVDAKYGFGMWLTACTDVLVEGVDMRNRETALLLQGGNSNQILDADMTNSGINDVLTTMILENIQVDEQSDLIIRDVIVDGDAFTVLNLIGSTGIVISGDDVDEPNVRLDNEMFTGRSTVRLQSCTDVSMLNLSFRREDQLIGTEGIISEGFSTGTIVENCYFEGFASGINIAETYGAKIYCNTMVANSNGIWVFYDSTIDDMADNSFRCNAIGINNHTDILITSDSDYWGDANGSSSFSGLGDFYNGEVDASAYSSSAPLCAYTVSAEICGVEVCNNGIDDDGDGVIDCDDSSCLDSPDCGGGNSPNDESQFSSVSPLMIGAEMRVYPNPSQGQFTIELKQPFDQISLRDMNGRVLEQRESVMAGLSTWDVSGVEKGMYLIDAVSGSHRETSVLVIE